jgi:hypothetical protein
MQQKITSPFASGYFDGESKLPTGYKPSDRLNSDQEVEEAYWMFPFLSHSSATSGAMCRARAIIQCAKDQVIQNKGSTATMGDVHKTVVNSADNYIILMSGKYCDHILLSACSNRLGQEEPK